MHQLEVETGAFVQIIPLGTIYDSEASCVKQHTKMAPLINFDIKMVLYET